jgi:hypothetical protein
VVEALAVSTVVEALVDFMAAEAWAGPTAAEVSAVLAAGTGAEAGAGIGEARLFNLKFISR